MANRIMLNETSYHGSGAIQEIATEAKAHGFKKALVCSDPDLIKFQVTAKVTDILDKNGLEYEIQELITSLQSEAALLWIHQRQSVSSSQTRSLRM